MLAQLPWPIPNLLRASHALHNVASADFDPQRTLVLLEETDITKDWSARYPRVLRSGDNPMTTLEELMDLHEEVSTVIGLYAQIMNASMEMLVNPFVEVQPISLSSAEYSRLASSFWILKIFYQFRLNFGYYQQPNDFIPAFLRRLGPWQLEQGLSVESFFHRISLHQSFGLLPAGFSSSPLQRSYSVQYMTARSIFIRNYLKVITPIPGSSFDPPGRGSISFSRAICADTMHSGTSWHSLPLPPPPHGHEDPEELDYPPHENDPLRSHGWTYFELWHRAGAVSAREHDRFFLELAFFFWDKERLENWGLADPDEFPRAVLMLEERLEQCKRLR
jgi:hypothetical protein